jgi:hypothetical protein
MKSSAFFSSLLYLANVVSAATLTYNWDVTWVQANPDNRLTHPVVGINKQWPCPTISGNIGDIVVVTLNNKLGNETTSLHWHGLYQVGNNAQDGPPMVTQCPILPGQSYTYTFTVCCLSLFEVICTNINHSSTNQARTGITLILLVSTLMVSVDRLSFVTQRLHLLESMMENWSSAWLIGTMTRFLF